MPVSAWSGGLQSALLIVFALASVEKGQMLVFHTAEWHPIFVSTASLRRWAAKLVLFSLIADLGVILLLVNRPPVGDLAATLLVLLYSAAAWPAPHSDLSSCRCFWKVLNTSSRASLVVRNSLLILVSAGALYFGGTIGQLGLLVAPVVLASVSLAVRVVEKNALRSSEGLRHSERSVSGEGSYASQ